VGWIVLLWPTWIALLLAGHQTEHQPWLWVIFTLGVILTRSAGCVINDLTDRDFDRHVKRTRTRPLATGNLPVAEAVWLSVALLLMALALVLLTNPMTIALSVMALALALIYPWLKRVTFWPQIGLGLAFSMAIPMAFSAHHAPFNSQVLYLILGNLAWTLAYDTFYAMVDRDDDVLIGVKSTAIYFGRFGLALSSAGLGMAAALGWLGALGFSVHHQWIARTRARADCFRAFLENHRFGACLFCGVAIDLCVQTLSL
jgi:4-hydroxybenzoate polyprenyltransferase